MWNRLQERFEQFVKGRYGRDELFYVLLVLSVLLWTIGLFTAVIVLIVLGMILMLLAFLRTLSRNSAARKKENSYLLKVWLPFRRGVKLWYYRIRDCRKFVYVRCPGCRATIRMPRRKGTGRAVCPGCKTRFEVRVLWQWPGTYDDE